MRVHRRGTGIKAVRAVFMAVRVNMRRLACVSVGMHPAIGMTVLVSLRLVFDPDFA